MKALGVVLLKSVGAGYSALNMLGQFPGLEILEFAPLGSSSQLLILGNAPDINSYVAELRTGDLERTMCIPNFDKDILRSYLSLENSKLQDFVLTIESNFSGDLFQAAAELKPLGLSVIDFRVFRTQGSPGFLVLSGSDSEHAKKWMDQKSSQVNSDFIKLNFTLTQNLTKSFRQFVDLDS